MNRTSLVLLLFILSITTSCRSQEKPVTPEEALAFGKQLEATIAVKNPSLFNDLFDAESFKDRIREAGNKKIPRDIVDNIPAKLKQRKYGLEIIKSLEQDGTFQLIKTYEKKGKQHLIFRLWGTDGLNYQDIELTRSGKEIKAADIFIYMSGENISKSMADIFLMLGDYFDENTKTEDLQKSIVKFQSLRVKKEYEEAVKVFNSFPVELRNQKSFQLLYLQVTVNMDPEIYQKALNEYEKLYPYEPRMSLVFLDIHFLQGDYEKAMKDINTLDSIIDKDPMLDYYRGLIYSSMENTAMAISSYERLYKNLPEFNDGIVELISSYALIKDFEKGKAMIKTYRLNKGFKQENIDLLYEMYPELRS